jgi:hypothetical protein
MKINQIQLNEVLAFLRGEQLDLSLSLVESIELRVGLQPETSLLISAPVGGRLESLATTKGPVFVDGAFTPVVNRAILEGFRDGLFPYLLVRVEKSWQCLIRCNGEILEDTCSEEKEDTVQCCDKLRDECGLF